MSIPSIFRRVVGEDLSLFGFETGAKKPFCVRRFEPWIEQRVTLVSSRSHAGSKVFSLMLGTSIAAFEGSPGDYGPGLDWTFTMSAVVGNPVIACELEQFIGGADQQVEEWLRSMSRELQGVGLQFFDRTRSVEGLIDFAMSDFCRARAASYSEVYARLQRAMLHRLAGRSGDFEKEIELATTVCKTRWRASLDEFVAFVRGVEV